MSREEQRLTERLQRGLQRRMRRYQQRSNITADRTDDEAEASASSACLSDSLLSDQLAALQWEVEDVRCTSLPINDNSSGSSAHPTHTVAANMMDDDGSGGGGPLRLPLASLHPSRELASAHLDAALAASVNDTLRDSRFWLRRIEWSVVNWNVDETVGRMKLQQLHICCATDADADAAATDSDEHRDRTRGHATAESVPRVHFALPLLESICVADQLTLSCRRVLDEQASQIAFHTAQQEQIESGSASSSSSSHSARAVLEHEYQRFTEVVSFSDERASTAATAASSIDGRAGPVTAALLPCLARVLHGLSLPLTLHTSTLFHALSGFGFLQHLLPSNAATHAALLDSVWAPTSEARTRAAMERLVQQHAWPRCSAVESSSSSSSPALVGCANDDDDASLLVISDYCRHTPPITSNSSMQLSAATSSPLPPLDQEDSAATDAVEVEAPAPLSRFARLAPPVAAAAAAGAYSSLETQPADEVVDAPTPSSADQCEFQPRTLPALVCSYLRMDEWALELYLDAMSSAATAAAASAVQSRGSAKNARRGRGKPTKKR